MSEDKFDNRRPQIAFSEETVTVRGRQGERLQGEFSMRSTNEVSIRGIVYSSNPYVRIVKPQFDGMEATIRFEVLGQDYQEGDRLTGYFTIVCNQRECRLPFDVQFEADRLYASTGEIASLSDFASLAQGHWAEAMQLFYSQAFEKFIARQEKAVRMVYTGYRKALPSSANLEEFLVAVGLKDAVDFTVRERKEEFYRVSENRKETLVVAKNTWGYIEITVESDSPFVTVEKDLITTDYFLGSTMLLNYYIHKNRMHAGINRARITFSCKGTVRVIDIMATFDQEDEKKEFPWRRDKECLADLTDTYKAYRFRQITTGEWCDGSVQILDELLERRPNNAWYRLMKAQCLIVGKKRQEALWIISDMKREIADKQSVLWAYLLYLCTLIEQEKSYVDRLTKEIETIFREHPEDVRLFWFLSFLREEYMENPARKLKAILQWIEADNDTPFLYIEAYAMYVQDPYLLHAFDAHATKILYWAARHVTFTKDVAMQILHVMENVKDFDPHIFLIAQKAYEVEHSEEAFSVLVSYLLRNQMFQEKYLDWYREAIRLDLRLSGLYEAYMLSMPDNSTEELPQMVTMYFRYSCNLPYQKKALLYANIISERRKAPGLYEQYLRNIETFAIEQMKANRMNDNLAIIYQNVLEMGVVDEEMAHLISGMVFMKKLVCLYPDITRAFIYQEQYEMPIVIPVQDHQACIPILPGQYRLLLETGNGTLISDHKAYTLQRLMYPERFIKRLEHLSPLSLPFILADFAEKKEAADYTLDDVKRMQVFLDSSLVSKRYKQEKYSAFIGFLQDHCREEVLEEHFAKHVDFGQLDARTRGFVISLFIQRQDYERAYALMQDYYGLQVDDRLLLQMCTERLLTTEFAEDEFLLSLCGYLLGQKQTSPATVSYLAENYVGPSLDMIYLWQAAKAEEMSVVALEENILFQTLYAENCMEETAAIYASYLARGKDRMLIEAYLNYWAHAYMLSKEHVPDKLFDYLSYYFAKGIELKESCNLAYMKYLSGKDTLDEKEFALLDQLLQYYILRNVYFQFYKNVDHKLIIKYHLYDKHFVEYRGNPGERITITYRFDDGQPITEEMIEMYEGIFVKQFVVFFGETIHYALYADAVADLPVCADDLTISSDLQEGNLDRYDLLNAMQNAYLYHEDGQLLELMKQYQGLDQVTKELFTTV